MRLNLLAVVFMLGCTEVPEELPKHMLIEEGHYRLDPDSTIHFHFNKDGTGDEIYAFNESDDPKVAAADSIIFLFTWNTADWSKGTKVLEMHLHRQYSSKTWKTLNDIARYPIRDITDSGFQVCRDAFNACYYNERDPWRRAVKIDP